MGKIALFGAAGATGTSIANALREQGKPYRSVGRSRAALEAAFGHDALAETAIWKPDDPAPIRAAAHGIEPLIHLVDVPYHQFHLHPTLMRKTLDAAVGERVKRIVLI